jgi:hypothetical protein
VCCLPFAATFLSFQAIAPTLTIGLSCGLGFSGLSYNLDSSSHLNRSPSNDFLRTEREAVKQSRQRMRSR